MSDQKKAVALSPQQQNLVNINSVMEKYKNEIARALPKHMTADRMARVALTCLRENPKLAECEPLSFMGAILKASSLGLEPGLQGHAYLIPYRNNKKGITECNFIPGYRGLIDLARRSKEIQSIAAHVVKENDEFDYEYGLDEKLIHKPAVSDRGKTYLVYAVAKLVGGGHQFEVMDMQQIEDIRKRAPYDNPVWKSDFDEMCRKTAVRRLVKYLPTSVELRETLGQEELADKNAPQGNQAVIDVNYTTDFTSDEAPIDIKEINKEASAAKEAEDTKQAEVTLLKRVSEMQGTGWKLEEILKKLKIEKLADLKGSKAIYAALEVLHDAT